MNDNNFPSPTPYEIEQAAFKKIIPEGKHRTDENASRGEPEMAPAPKPEPAAVSDADTTAAVEKTSEPSDDKHRAGYKTRDHRAKE